MIVEGTGDELVEHYKLQKHKDAALLCLRALICYHLIQTTCNAHVISTTDKSMYLLKESDEQKVDKHYQEKLGLGIYSTSSLMNHSCDPNVMFR